MIYALVKQDSPDGYYCDLIPLNITDISQAKSVYENSLRETVSEEAFDDIHFMLKRLNGNETKYEVKFLDIVDMQDWSYKDFEASEIARLKNLINIEKDAEERKQYEKLKQKYEK